MSIARILVFSIAIIVIGGWCFVWFMHIVALIYGKYKLHRPLPPVSPEDLQGVSIIKPLIGVDPNLFSNLETFFKSKYPLFELMFCVQDESDPAIMVVQKLIEKYPTVDAKLFIGIRKVGPNGKINNMVRAWEASKYDLIVISDSGICMEEDTLMDMAAHCNSAVGMVLAMPYASDRTGFASVYEKVYFGAFQARNCLSGNGVGINCSTGMSCLLRKETIDSSGGLKAFGKYLAEDYFLATAVRNQGYKVVLCSQPAMQNSGEYSIPMCNKRLIRWAKLRVAMLPHLILLEPLSECMVQGVMISWAMEFLFNFSPMAVFLLHVLVWFLCDYTLVCLCENGPLTFSKFEFLVAWMLREISALYLTLQVHLDYSVTWRHKRYHLYWGGIAEEIPNQ